MEWLILLGIFWGAAAFLERSSKSSTKTTYMPRPIPPKPQLNEKRTDVDDLKLSPEQQKLFEKLEKTKNHIFVTGKAGTGKSALLQYFKRHSAKRLVVVAPTGVAALNVGGQTIHSLFKIPPSFIKKSSLSVDPRTAMLLRNLDTVVIDEISMVRADLMDAIDHLLRQARGNSVSFGGVQMIMFGDLYQLPPVVSDPELHKYFADNHGGYYFFNADVWQNTALEIYELTQVFRQKDEGFKEILNAIRIGSVDDQLLSLLNVRTVPDIPSDGVITLATTNKTVSAINHARLAQLPGEMHEYRAVISGKLEESSYPTEEILCLKKGAQVMLIKNDKEKRWVNGTLGYIDSLSNNEIKVNIDGIVYSVPQETWSKIRYYYNQAKRSVEEEIVSSFTQYPLRLAWAVTVHKSQGRTYGSITVDMGDGAFAHGQTYVALSRCKSLEGLFLKREILREDIIVDPAVINFMARAEILDIDRSKHESRN